VKVVVLECCEKTTCRVPESADIINLVQIQQKYGSGAAKRQLRVEQEKQDDQNKKMMLCLLTRPVTSSGHKGGGEFSERGPIFLNYVQHILPRGAKNFRRGEDPPVIPGFGPAADLWV